MLDSAIDILGSGRIVIDYIAVVGRTEEPVQESQATVRAVAEEGGCMSQATDSLRSVVAVVVDTPAVMNLDRAARNQLVAPNQVSTQEALFR